MMGFWLIPVFFSLYFSYSPPNSQAIHNINNTLSQQSLLLGALCSPTNSQYSDLQQVYPQLPKFLNSSGIGCSQSFNSNFQNICQLISQLLLWALYSPTNSQYSDSPQVYPQLPKCLNSSSIGCSLSFNSNPKYLSANITLQKSMHLFNFCCFLFAEVILLISAYYNHVFMLPVN